MAKFNVIFDIDETLVNTVKFDSFSDLKDMSNNLIFKKLDLPKAKLVMFFRPKLLKLIDFCFKNFNVGFWTAGNSLYCKKVLGHLLNEEQYNNCNLILAREKNDYVELKTKMIYKNITDEYMVIKPLDLLWNDETLSKNFNEDNTIIIDNNPDILNQNPENSVVIKDFIRQSNDDYLSNLTELLIKINEYDSVKCKNVLDLISTFSNLEYN